VSATAPRGAVVIGGGIGGLSCACLLAKEGVPTLLLEKNREAGGTAGGFTHRGLHLELGCNVSGPAGDGRSLGRFLRYFGVADDIGLEMLPKEACVHVCADGETFPLPAGIEAYTAAVASRFPGDREDILAFGRRVRFILDRLPLVNLSRYFELAPDVETKVLLANDSVADVMGSIRSAGARRLLALFWRFIGTTPEDCPMSLYAPEMGAFLEGPCTLRGEDLRAAFVRRLASLGGRLQTSRAVTSILVDGREVRGVRTGDGETVEADLVVSAIHPLRTMELIDDPLPVRRMKRRIEQAGETCGTFVAYFTRDEGPAAPRAHPAWTQVLAEGDGPARPAADAVDAGSLDIGFLTGRPSGRGPAVCRAIVMLDDGVFAAWRDTTTRRRGEAYEGLKASLASAIRETLERRLPARAGGLRHLVSVTPLTLRDELGHRGGGFGVLRGARRRGLGTCSWKTPVKGLFIGGQSALFPGIMGTLETSFLIGASVFGEKHMVGRFGGL